MILDKDLNFSLAQTVTSGGSDASTNYIDLGATVREIGTGESMEFLVLVSTTMVGAGEVVVTVEQDDNSSFSTATTVQTIGTFATVSPAGTRLTAKVQPEAITERYVRLKYTNGVVSAGAFSAYLTHGVDHYRSYADAIAITG